MGTYGEERKTVSRGLKPSQTGGMRACVGVSAGNTPGRGRERQVCGCGRSDDRRGLGLTGQSAPKFVQERERIRPLHRSRRDVQFATVRSPENPASFAHENHAGREVPGHEDFFPEGIE